VYPCETLPGYGDEENLSITNILPHDGWMYLGTFNLAKGAEVWRWDGTDVFEPVMIGGWGVPYNQFIHSMILFQGNIYAGTWIDVPSLFPHPERGMSIWRFAAGEWEPVTEDGFGDFHNDAATSMAVFQDTLYVGVYNPNDGPEVWRSADGDAWGPVVADQVDADDTGTDENGFGCPENTDATVIGVFRERLHVFTESKKEEGSGTQAWASSAEGSPPFADLVQVNQNGYGNPQGTVNCNTAWNMNSALTVHDGFLYVGTWNYHGEAQVFRTDGESQEGDPSYVWEPVSPPGFGLTQSFVQPLAVFHGYLFTSSYGPGGARLWALSLDGTAGSLSGSWICVVANGFGHAPQRLMIPTGHASGDTLYLSLGAHPLFPTAKRPELWALSFEGPLDWDGDGFSGGEFADCDDGDSAVNPAVPEISGNGIDDDCDPSTPDQPAGCGTLSLGAVPGAWRGQLHLFLVLALPALMIRLQLGRRPRTERPHLGSASDPGTANRTGLRHRPGPTGRRFHANVTEDPLPRIPGAPILAENARNGGSACRKRRRRWWWTESTPSSRNGPTASPTGSVRR